MPEPEQSETMLEAADNPSDSDLSVVVLPKQSPDEETAPSAPPAPIAATPQSPPLGERVIPPPQPEPLLQTDVIARDVSSEPALPEEPVTPDPAIDEPSLPTTSTEPTEPQAAPEPESEPEPAESPPAGPLVSYSDAFPHFEGAVGGCFGFNQCRRVSDAGSYRSVARSLISGLEAQGYRVDLRDDLEDTGRNVYELVPPNSDVVQYLLVFSDSDGSAVYVMSDTIMTLNDLQALQAQSAHSRQSS